MGYSTYFHLSREDNEDFTPEQVEAIESMDVFETFESNRVDCNSKWYEYEADMRKLSSSIAFTGVILFLAGEGEGGASDVWHAYYLNGKEQFCRGEVVYPALDLALFA